MGVGGTCRGEAVQMGALRAAALGSKAKEVASKGQLQEAEAYLGELAGQVGLNIGLGCQL